MFPPLVASTTCRTHQPPLIFTADCYHGLGVESGAIPDGLIYSHAYLTNTQFAYHGRLNGDFPHCAKTLNDRAFYVDLRELHWIVAVAIQGYNKNGIEGRITYMAIKTRLHNFDSDITDVDDRYTVSLRLC